MTTQSEVIRLTKLCQRQGLKIKRMELEQQRQFDEYEALKNQYFNLRYGPVKHPQQAEPGWTPPPEAQSWWQRLKSWVIG